MQQANQVLSPPVTLIPPHEAEQRAMDILRVVLKEYDIKKTYPSAPPLSEWCQLMLILGAVPSIPPDLPNVEEVFRAGLIERIIRYLVDFHSLPDQSNIPIVSKPGDEHGNAIHWYRAFGVLRSISTVVYRNPVLYNLDALIEYRRFGGELIRIYPNIPVFWWEPDEDDDSRQLTIMRSVCLDTLRPLIDEGPCEEKFPSPSLDDVCALVPMFARLRRSIRAAPASGEARRFVATSAEGMIKCSRAISVAKPPGEWNLQELTGLCHSELTRQCLISAETEDAIIRAHQSDVINAMVIVDNSPALNDVIASQRIITRSASTMKLLRSHLDEFPNNHASPDKPHSRDWYGRTIMMFHTVLGQACFEGDRRPVIEAVTSKLLHLVEWWSSTGSAVVLKDIELFTVLLCMGVKRTDARLQEDILNQLRTVAFRMDSRLDVNPEVVNAWNVAYIFATEYCPDTRVYHSGPICANIGCECAIPAGMVCSGCQWTYYCSKACQKAWVP